MLYIGYFIDFVALLSCGHATYWDFSDFVVLLSCGWVDMLYIRHFSDFVVALSCGRVDMLHIRHISDFWFFKVMDGWIYCILDISVIFGSLKLWTFYSELSAWCLGTQVS